VVNAPTIFGATSEEAPARCLFFCHDLMRNTAATAESNRHVTPTVLEFDLPAELIAQVPADRRDAARLMVLDRRNDGLTHTGVADLPAHLRSGDLLVVNDTRVIPARVFGRVASGGAVEVLLIRPALDAGEAPRDGRAVWISLGRPGRRLRPGAEIQFPNGTRATILARTEDGRYTIAFDSDAAVADVIARHGELPLPPYIKRPDGPLPLDQQRYQTIFAARPGAIAAPTAGLHFTDDLVATLGRGGVEVVALTLHVGPGTFLPLRYADVGTHRMDPEWCNLPEATAARIRQVKAAGGRVVAVGTTTTRALESAAADEMVVAAGPRWADAFIVPGYRFRVVDALFTNFHLPGSTLLLLVSAFAGPARIRAAYAAAVERRYRFYSYGDAMLIQ